MKKIKLSIAIVGIVISGCTSYIDDLCQLENTITKQSATVTQHIDEQEALSIANKVLKSGKTRATNYEYPNFAYVTKNASRSNDVDTLAYVLNYPNNSGFVIVATSRCVYPVLGFSDEGNFSFDNEISKTNFIEYIGDYIANADSSKTYDVSDNDFDNCYSISPMVQSSLSQRSPWNKYVIQEHPGCPVGCVAVATALVMSHSKLILSYHNSKYYLRSIVMAIHDGQNATESTSSTVRKRIIGGNPYVQYSYEQAVDSMAKILYWIGKDVNMNYSTTSSGAVSYDAYTLCKSLGFNIQSGFADFDITEVTRYLSDGCIIYLRGRDTDKNSGHAWVSDGCYYCVDYGDNTVIKDTYIHCDWGWGGSCNGYYSGSVFEASGYNFTLQNYFAIKREWTK